MLFNHVLQCQFSDSVKSFVSCEFFNNFVLTDFKRIVIGQIMLYIVLICMFIFILNLWTFVDKVADGIDKETP